MPCDDDDDALMSPTENIPVQSKKRRRSGPRTANHVSALEVSSAGVKVQRSPGQGLVRVIVNKQVN